jgi:DNA polymerase-3 subunit delta'
VSGADGLGKRQLVTAFAAALLCHRPNSNGAACGVCSGCQLLAAGTHPDLLFIEPDEPGKAIGIDKIRQLIGKLALKPQYEQFRVVIIGPADQLNTASANAFLKCLEEPTERTCLVLISERPSRLPATIRSRCQVIVCHAPATQDAIQWLQGCGVGQAPEVLLALANGAPLTAKRYADQNLSAVRQDCFDAWLQVAGGKTNLLALAEQWQKPGVLDLGLLLDWMIGWIGDIVKLAYGADACQLRNPDIKNPLQALAKRLELTHIFAYYDSLLTAQSQLGTPINKQLLLEQLLINWSQLNTR